MQRVTAGDGSITIFSGARAWYSSDTASIPVEKKPRAVTKNRASAKGPPPIINPIFEALSNLSTDSFWKELFHKAALDDFPRGFAYFNGELTHKIRNKITSLPVSNTPETALSQVKRFMGETAAVMSQEDMRAAKMEEEERLTKYLSETVVTWSSIRNTARREVLITHYASRVGDYYKLKPCEVDGLVSTIKMGVAAGYFNSDNITVVGGTITSIGGLVLSNENRFVIDLTKVKSKSRRAADDSEETEVSGGADLFMKSWIAIISALKKKMPAPRPEKVVYTPPPGLSVPTYTEFASPNGYYSQASGSPPLLVLSPSMAPTLTITSAGTPIAAR